MNRYPSWQRQLDDEDRSRHGRSARLRPGATVIVQGLKTPKEPGPSVIGRALVTRVSDMMPESADAVLVSTREYGQRWFHTHGHPFRVVKEVCP